MSAARPPEPEKYKQELEQGWDQIVKEAENLCKSRICKKPTQEDIERALLEALRHQDFNKNGNGNGNGNGKYNGNGNRTNGNGAH